MDRTTQKIENESENYFNHAESLLADLHSHRQNGATNDNAFCVFSSGDLYIQFLVPHDSEIFICEVASAYSVPWAERLLTNEKDKMLIELGFLPPGQIRNYSMITGAASAQEFKRCANLVICVFRDIYGVPFESIVTESHIPSPSGRAMASINVGLDKIMIVLLAVLGIIGMILLVVTQAKR